VDSGRHIGLEEEGKGQLGSTGHSRRDTATWPRFLRCGRESLGDVEVEIGYRLQATLAYHRRHRVSPSPVAASLLYST
jgi:hypothetical protein